jgi:uncharacterized protein YceK
MGVNEPSMKTILLSLAVLSLCAGCASYQGSSSAESNDAAHPGLRSDATMGTIHGSGNSSQDDPAAAIPHNPRAGQPQ